MRLAVHVPTGVVLDAPVRKIVAEAANGSFCLLPRHVDFVAALVPGILAFESEAGVEGFLAVDRAILVKRGAEVDVSAQRAVHGADLAELERTVREVFERLDDSELRARSALARLSVGFQRRLLEASEALRT